MQRLFYLVKTEKGHPALWECGGGMTHTGSAQIIAGVDGRPKRPIYIQLRGHRALGDHALFIVDVGDHIIRARHRRHNFEVEVWRVVSLSNEDNGWVAAAELTNSFSEENGWTPTEPQGILAKAVEAAKKKATCYHCRTSHWSI